MNTEHPTPSMLSENVLNAQAAWLKLDENRLRAFLQAQSDVVGGVGQLSLTYPTSGQGISNGIAFLSVDLDTGGGLEHRELVVRYAPGTTLLKQKSFRDEFLTMQCVEAADIPAPKALWLDAEGEALGVKGYIMERIYGDIPAAGMFTSGMLAVATPLERKRLMLEAVGFHGRLRRIALGAERVPHLVARGKGSTPIEREAQWWMEEARHNLVEGDDKLVRIRSAFHWILSHQPSLRPATLVHGDAQLCNLIYRDGQVIAAIDWELAYLGHGESDLAMIIWLTRLQRMFERDLQGIPEDPEFIARYEEESGANIEHYSFLRLMQIFKLVCVLTASARTMPLFEEFWERNWSELMAVWDECRAEYGVC